MYESKEMSRVKKLTVSAMLMAMNIIMSSSAMSIPVPGGHMYFCGTVIVIAAVLLDPLYAFAVGGVGSFLGDALFYPAPMFVSLVTHGLQAVVISYFVRHIMKDRPALSSCIGAAIGVAICVVGYSFGRAFIYSTPEYALLKLPFELFEASASSAIGLVLCWKAGLVRLFRREIRL